MPDTIRTLAELNSLFADNNTGSISPQDIRDLVVSMMVHGEIGSLAKPSVTLAPGWQALDFDQAGAISRGLTLDVANKWIADIPVDLVALVHCEIEFRGDQNNDYQFTVFLNPDTTPQQVSRLTRTLRIVSNSHRVSHSWATGLSLSAGDKLQMAVSGDGQDFELLAGVLRVQRIGVE